MATLGYEDNLMIGNADALFEAGVQSGQAPIIASIVDQRGAINAFHLGS